MKEIYLICGIPGSGKDWYVNNIIRGNVVSFDDIRVMCYENFNPNHGLGSIDLYNKAWEHCNSKKIDLMLPLTNRIKYLFEINQIPCICNTLLTRKSRERMLNDLKRVFKDVKFNAVFLTVDSKTALERNANRNTHRLSEDVMNRFLNGPLELPSCIEGFETVKVVHNG